MSTHAKHGETSKRIEALEAALRRAAHRLHVCADCEDDPTEEACIRAWAEEADKALERASAPEAGS